VLDVGTGEVLKSIDVGAQPERMGITPNGRRVYVNNLGDDTMSVVDIEAGEVVATIPMGDLPFNVLVSQNGKRVYVGVIFSNYIAVIDTDTNTVIDEIPVPTPNGMAFSRNRQSIYVTNVFANTIQEVSLPEAAVVRTAPAGLVPGFIRLTVDGKRAYFARPYGSAVSVFDTASLSELAAIPTGSPTSLTVCNAP
jgi:YVTN family beta-propeller protein